MSVVFNDRGYLLTRGEAAIILRLSNDSHTKDGIILDEYRWNIYSLIILCVSFSISLVSSSSDPKQIEYIMKEKKNMLYVYMRALRPSLPALLTT